MVQSRYETSVIVDGGKYYRLWGLMEIQEFNEDSRKIDILDKGGIVSNEKSF
ncbi:MAG: hypothetical protein ACLTCQ_12795 [Enterocloster bolteae]